jgi:hypothetical protein
MLLGKTVLEQPIPDGSVVEPSRTWWKSTARNQAALSFRQPFALETRAAVQ